VGFSVNGRGTDATPAERLAYRCLTGFRRGLTAPHCARPCQLSQGAFFGSEPCLTCLEDASRRIEPNPAAPTTANGVPVSAARCRLPCYKPFSRGQRTGWHGYGAVTRGNVTRDPDTRTTDTGGTGTKSAGMPIPAVWGSPLILAARSRGRVTPIHRRLSGCGW
jgi:hypothetical protein